MDLLKRKARAIPPNTTFRLTQEGREKLQEFNGSAASKVLMALEVRGTSLNVDEIAHEARLGKGKVADLLPALIRGNYISSSLGSPSYDE